MTAVLVYRTRKEYLDFLPSRRLSYLALSDLLGGMTIIAPQPIQEVERQVLREVHAKLPPQGSQQVPTFAHTAPNPSK